MTFPEFLETLSAPNPPDGLGGPLEALWWSRRGEWERAHRIVQALETPEAAWVHAHLHREEGDHANAGYWYRRAERSAPSTDLASEWEDIARALLAA